LENFEPNREWFVKDPFGYSAKGTMQWKMFESIVTDVNFDPFSTPKAEDLKNPILWLAQSEALTQAAITLIHTKPEFKNMPPEVRGVCDSQFCAASLMLIGYSLEVSLKAMMLVQKGTEGYSEIEKEVRHHRLHDLAKFIPNLNKKESAILRGLTSFVYWAGRYPDPGSGREKEAVDIFGLSEKYQISAKCLFDLTAKVQSYASSVVEKSQLTR